MKFIYQIFLVMILSSDSSFSQPLNSKLDSILNELHISTRTTYGLSIIQKGTILYQNSVGTLTGENYLKPDQFSNYRMASVSKQFTAAAIYLLIRQKKLKLEQNLSSVLPAFGNTGRKITIHHLLTHTSGITDYEELMNDEIKEQLSDHDVMNMVAKSDKTYFEPGSAFRYSNSAYCILSLIVEKISGQSFQAFCEKYIFSPLKMNNTVWYGNTINNRIYGYAKDKSGEIKLNDQSLTSATLGDGGLYTSLDDYTKWYLNRKNVLGLDFDVMTKSSSAPIKKNYSYSYGWFYEHDENQNPSVILHSGATCGFSNIVIEIPKKQMMIAYFTNLANHHNTFTEIEKVLKSSGYLSPGFSYRRMHDETH